MPEKALVGPVVVWMSPESCVETPFSIRLDLFYSRVLNKSSFLGDSVSNGVWCVSACYLLNTRTILPWLLLPMGVSEGDLLLCWPKRRESSLMLATYSTKYSSSYSLNRPKKLSIRFDLCIESVFRVIVFGCKDASPLLATECCC